MAGQISTGIASSAMTRAEFGEQDSSESYFENYLETVYARIMNIKVDFTNYSGDTLIWGNSTFGIWGSFRWNNTSVSTFVLDNPIMGVLGRNTLGSNVSTPYRQYEKSLWLDYEEEFDTTTYRDTGSTTARGWGAGSVVFYEGTGSTTIDFTAGSYTAAVSVATGYIQLS